MSYNGSGTFLINSTGQPVVAGTVISSSTFNALTADLATGLSTAITKDGQTTVTNNIPLNNFKVTNLGAGTVASDAARLDQVQSGATTSLAVTGTDTYVGTVSPSLAVYTTGNTFSFVVPNTNTGPATLNISSLGAKTISRDGSTALIAGDLVAGSEVTVVYDGTRFQVINSNTKTNFNVSGTLKLLYSNAGAASLSSPTSTALAFGLNSGSSIVEQMRLNNTGLGIGITSPSQKLDVNGDALINSVRVGRGPGNFNFNTVLGYGTLASHQSGQGNVAIGYATLGGNTTGAWNVGVGTNALIHNDTGSGNTAINPYDSAGNYNPVFDPITQSDRVCMGSTGVTNAYVQVAWTVVSDARDKTDFADVPHGLSFVNKLNPIAYRYKVNRNSTEAHGPIRYGFKAQEVLELEGNNPVIVDAEDKEKLRFNDQSLIAILVKAIQEQQVIIEKLKADVLELKNV